MKKGEIKTKKTLGEVIEDFRYSDSIPATAAKFLLMTLAMGPLIVAGAAFPNLFLALESLKTSENYSRKQTQRAFQNLKYKNLIEIIEEGDEKFKVRLTNKGKKRVKEYCFETLEISKPKKWDKKWRILIFDIPTKPKIYHQAREALRAKIKKLGFYQLQKSVWVYPYECEDEILFIAELFYVQKYIEIITAEKILHEEILKKAFQL